MAFVALTRMKIQAKKHLRPFELYTVCLYGQLKIADETAIVSMATKSYCIRKERQCSREPVGLCGDCPILYEKTGCVAT